MVVLGLLLSPTVFAYDGSLSVPKLPPILQEPTPTLVVVRVVAHGAMVLGQEVGGARVTITNTDTGEILASGIQQGESGDQNQIMRTPHLMKEPLYSGLPSASYQTTLKLDRPTLVTITAQGPLAFPQATRRASKTVLLVPGQDLHEDGIVIDLSGFIVTIVHPTPGQQLISKDDVNLVASIRTLSGSPLRPHGDWDSRETLLYGDVLVEGRIIERIQLFYSGKGSHFEASFFVPLAKQAPNGITLRVVVADGARGNFGVGEETYPVLPEQVRYRDTH